MSRRPLHKRVVRAVRFAVRELRAPVTRNTFAGAAMNRILLDWVAASRSADEEIKYDLRRLRARARQLARDNSYVRRYFRLLVNNVVGPFGIKLQAKITRADGELDRETNVAIEAAWTAWATGPVTLDGRLTLRRLEELLVKTLAQDGEAWVRVWKGVDVNPFGIALQTIDADLIDERFNRPRRDGANEVRMGVEVDDVGRPVAYHVWKQLTISGIELTRERYRVPANEMLHLYNQDRVNQTRGVTWLHSVMSAAHMLDAYEETEAVAARVSSAKMGFFEPTPENVGGDLASEKIPATMEANPGTFEIMPQGYTLKPWSPDHPTGQFPAFVKQMLRKIASGFDVFYNTLANDAEGVSYSSMRSFGLIERDDWKGIQQDFVELWRRPLYSEWIRTALLSGALRLSPRDPARYAAVRHRPRGWDWVDPEKAAKGAVLAIQNGLGTRTAVLAEKGEELEEVFQELKRENELAAEYGLSIGSEIPEDEKLTREEWEAQAAEETAGSGGGNGVDRGTEQAPSATHSPPLGGRVDVS